MVPGPTEITPEEREEIRERAKEKILGELREMQFEKQNIERAMKVIEAIRNPLALETLEQAFGSDTAHAPGTPETSFEHLQVELWTRENFPPADRQERARMDERIIMRLEQIEIEINTA